MTEVTIESYDFMVNAEKTHVGLIINYSDDTSATIPFPAHDAERVGALLVAHSDWLAGRPPRQW